MFVLIVKNKNTNVARLEKYTKDSYVFPTLREVEQRGNELLETGEYVGFNSMSVEYFIRHNLKRYGFEEPKE